MRVDLAVLLVPVLALACAPIATDIGGDAPDVTLPDHTGVDVSLHDYAGDVLLVDLSSYT